MGNLIPGEPLSYERENGVVYARYARMPWEPRWIVGGDPGAVARANGDLLDYTEWKELCELAAKHPALKKQMDQIIFTYYLIKEKE